MSDLVTIDIKDHVADVRLNRPEKMNAVNPAMWKAIYEAGASLEDNREVCASRSFLSKQICLGWAQVFYWAVRAFGGFQDELL